MTEQEVNKEYKTFSIHETDLSTVKIITKSLFTYKHLENILNMILKQEYEKKNEISKEIFNLLLNPIVMKAVLSNNTGQKTADNIEKVNEYFKDNDLMKQAKKLFDSLNAHNISMIIRRLKKDWSHYFVNLKEYFNNPISFNGEPSYPKSKKLSKVFNYSLPLETSKFSIKKIKQGLLGINLGKKMFYVYIGKNIDYITNKIINNVTISYSHGHIYYNFTYKYNEKQKSFETENINKKIITKEAGIDVGVNNLLSIFVNDNTTCSLIISGKKLTNYNCYFNKRIAETNEAISKNVKSYKNVVRYNEKLYKVPESYTNEGLKLKNRKEQLFERRKLFFYDYMNKVSKKVLQYLKLYKVTKLVLSKNLSFTKISGEIKMRKKEKQKFYQIPFGMVLNLIKEKSSQYGIDVVWIDEAYTSKTSSLNADVNAVQKKWHKKEEVTSNDLNGNRGVKIKNVDNNIKNNYVIINKGTKKIKLSRGDYKDKIINKVVNADINAACNHIKVYLKDKAVDMIYNIKKQSNYLWKWCNPVKIKSNSEFDILLCRIVNE